MNFSVLQVRRSWLGFEILGNGTALVIPSKLKVEKRKKSEAVVKQKNFIFKRLY